MVQGARFWDRLAKRYSKKPVADEAAYQKKLEVTRKYFRPDMEVLEFGCGTGSTAIAHAPFVKHIRATDISSAMIEIGKGKAEDANIENVTFEQATIEDIDVAAESVDAVLGLSVLHLIEDWEGAIDRVHAMLAPGGVFVSNTVCLGDNMKWFRFIGPVGRFLGLMPLVRVFSERELTDRLTRAGFEIDHQWRVDKTVVFIVAKKAV